MIYLIHIEPPVGKSAHYLGLCREERLQARLREHALGSGARLLKVAVGRGRALYLVRTIPFGDAQLERTLKNHGNLRLMCPMCCPLLAHLAGDAQRIDTSRPEQPAPKPLIEGWPGVAPPRPQK